MASGQTEDQEEQGSLQVFEAKVNEEYAKNYKTLPKDVEDMQMAAKQNLEAAVLTEVVGYLEFLHTEYGG